MRPLPAPLVQFAGVAPNEDMAPAPLIKGATRRMAPPPPPATQPTFKPWRGSVAEPPPLALMLPAIVILVLEAIRMAPPPPAPEGPTWFGVSGDVPPEEPEPPNSGISVTKLSGAP